MCQCCLLSSRGCRTTIQQTHKGKNGVGKANTVIPLKWDMEILQFHCPLLTRLQTSRTNTFNVDGQGMSTGTARLGRAFLQSHPRSECMDQTASWPVTCLNTYNRHSLSSPDSSPSHTQKDMSTGLSERGRRQFHYCIFTCAKSSLPNHTIHV